MPRKLLLLNAVLVAAAAVSAVVIVREVARPMPSPAARSRPAPDPAPVPAGAPRVEGGSYSVVAARNLFSPTRSEAPSTAGPATAGAPVAKPNLYGVVLREGMPVAYLEDPATKRVAGYRVGDTISGGTLQTITADSVVIARPDGAVDVRLRDPSKPRPAPVTPASGPGAPGQQPGQVPAEPGAPGVAQPEPPGAPRPLVPGRRPLPPNLLRRLPPGAPDAAQQ